MRGRFGTGFTSLSSWPPGLFRSRLHQPGTQTPVCNPELDFIPWLNSQAFAKGFGDGELSFTADTHGRHSHWGYYSKTGGLLSVLLSLFPSPVCLINSLALQK
jgi:hypothetical protein